jgi:hypothetical protein
MPAKRLVRTAVLFGAAAAIALIAPRFSGAIAPAAADPVFLQQWPDPAQRQQFYNQDQGSQLIPLAWLRALKTPTGQPFLGDQLARYGYLANPQSPNQLPVGFTINSAPDGAYAGMTCAACHTREIDAGGQTLRIDGGPALVDFQGFLTDLVAAVGTINASDQAFAPFAAQVLGPNATSAQQAALKQAMSIWYTREHAMVTGALPRADIWGLGRLDAISMIFNRLTGLDVGPAPTYVIANNIQPADAPARYPFVWNAPIQDHIQWPGFAQNGDNLLGLARNLGEVYGVFGTFHPKYKPFPQVLTRMDALGTNSANFNGLARLENLVAAITPPKWPFPVDAALASRGQVVFDRAPEAGGCVACHGEFPGEMRLMNNHTWKTPVQDVGTDSREYAIIARTLPGGAGSISGSRPPFGAAVNAQSTQFDMLRASVIASILQRGLQFPQNPDVVAFMSGRPVNALEMSNDLKYAFVKKQDAAPDAGCNKTNLPYCYESRVLHGIWAVAPYLHNGSVPTLADLLKPSAQRPASFAVGRNYDIAKVGLAAQQPGSYTRVTTDCTVRNSGNSRCGHEFGTQLSADDKTALLEYLKTL